MAAVLESLDIQRHVFDYKPDESLRSNVERMRWALAAFSNDGAILLSDGSPELLLRSCMDGINCNAKVVCDIPGFAARESAEFWSSLKAARPMHLTLRFGTASIEEAELFRSGSCDCFEQLDECRSISIMFDVGGGTDPSVVKAAVSAVSRLPGLTSLTLENLQLTNSQWVDVIPILASMRRLEVLNLTHAHQQGAHVCTPTITAALLDGCQNLHELDPELYNMHESNTCLWKAIGRHPKLQKIAAPALFGDDVAEGETALRLALQQSAGLKHLTITATPAEYSECVIRAVVEGALANSRCGLQSLQVSNGSGVQLAHLVSHLPSLRILQPGAYASEPLAILEALHSKINGVESLDLDSSGVPSAEDAWCAALGSPHCKLKVLRAESSTWSGPRNPICVGLGKNCTLEDLRLDYTALTVADSLVLESSLSNHPTLRNLSLRQVFMEEDGWVVPIARAVASNDVLEHLDLEDNYLNSGGGLVALADAIRSNRSLTVLHIPSALDAHIEILCAAIGDNRGLTCVVGDGLADMPYEMAKNTTLRKTYSETFDASNEPGPTWEEASLAAPGLLLVDSGHGFVHARLYLSRTATAHEWLKPEDEPPHADRAACMLRMLFGPFLHELDAGQVTAYACRAMDNAVELDKPRECILVAQAAVDVAQHPWTCHDDSLRSVLGDALASVCRRKRGCAGWHGVIRRCVYMGRVVSEHRVRRLVQWRQGQVAHRDASMVFKAASEGRPLELRKRLRLGHLAGGAVARGVFVCDGSGVGKQVSAVEAAELGGHEECAFVLREWGADGDSD